MPASVSKSRKQFSRRCRIVRQNRVILRNQKLFYEIVNVIFCIKFLLGMRIIVEKLNASYGAGTVGPKQKKE